MLIRYKYAKIKLEAELIERGFNINQINKAVAKFGRHRMLKYIELWDHYVKTRIKSKYYQEKRLGIIKYLQKNVKLNFGNRQWKKEPNIKWAYCRIDTFKQNKIIKYGDI